MSGRIRLLWAGLAAATVTSILVGTPAMIQAGVVFNALD
jgi:hypothetical protein